MINTYYLNEAAIEEFFNIFKKNKCEKIDKKYYQLCIELNKIKFKSHFIEIVLRKYDDKFIIADFDTFKIFEKNNIIYVKMNHNNKAIPVQKNLKNVLNNNCEFKEGTAPFLNIKDIQKIKELLIKLDQC